MTSPEPEDQDAGPTRVQPIGPSTDHDEASKMATMATLLMHLTTSMCTDAPIPYKRMTC